VIIKVGTSVEKDVALESSALQSALRMEVACERTPAREFNNHSLLDRIFYSLSMLYNIRSNSEGDRFLQISEITFPGI
jgi:hypothetical protein